MKFYLVAILVFLSWTQSLNAQESMLSFFSADMSGGKVLLSWTIQSGNTCNGVDIFRSTDSVSFTKIGDIPGVCGDLSSPKNYSFTDPSPEKNTRNFYKLDLGGQEFSWVIEIEVIDLTDHEMIIRPNPANQQTELIFNNDNNLGNTVSILNAYGESIVQFNTNQDQITIDTWNLNNGLYFIVVFNTEMNRKISQKLIVQH